MERASTGSIRAVIAVCLVVLAWCAWRAAVRPLTSGERRLSDHLVRVPAVEAIVQPNAWRGLYYAIAARRAVKLLRLSPFTLRLPSVLSAALYLWLVYLLSKKSLWFLWLVVYPLVTPAFTTAQGGGVASAFCLLALLAANWNLAGWSLGLALAFAPAWFWMPAAAALGRLAASREWTRWTQQVLIPALAAAFILLLIPLVHAGAGR
jgi:hypothetical protein